MARKPINLNLSESEKMELESIIRSRTSEQRMVERSKIILLTEEGKSLDEIERLLGISRVTANLWRKKFKMKRMEGLKDTPRSGRPRIFGSKDRLKVIARACQRPDNITHWTNRDLAKTLKEEDLHISKSTINRILSDADLKPHRVEMWLTSKDPEFEEKSAQVVGLYMNPPENALVICIDEKTGMQALGRKIPNEPMKPGIPERMEFEYIRHGTQALIASFVVQSGEVTGKTYDRHSRYEFLDFMEDIANKYPHQEVYFIMDNFRTHKTKEVQEWVQKQGGRIKFHFTPTHASWLNQIELWFSILARKFLKRNIFTSVKDMVKKLMAFIEEYNKTAKPFRWTYAGDPLKI